MMTYLMLAGLRPSFVMPSIISGSIAQAKLVSMRMMPALVSNAHDECWRVPSQYRLSNTLYGEAYQPARSGVACAPAALPRAAVALGAAPPRPLAPRAPAAAGGAARRLPAGALG